MDLDIASKGLVAFGTADGVSLWLVSLHVLFFLVFMLLSFSALPPPEPVTYSWLIRAS